MKILTIQHNPWEGPGRFLLETAEENGVTLCICKAWRDPFPDPCKFAGVILLGGGADVHEEDAYPFLRTEKDYITKLLELDRPCLGICLGHQLLADRLGAGIGANFCASIGLEEVVLTESGRRHPLFRGAGRSFPAFKWHGQTLLTPLPSHFQILAASKECLVEAFSITERPHIVGIQFDSHAAHPKDVAMWYDNDRDWLDSLQTFRKTKEQLVSELSAKAEEIRKEVKLFFRNYWSLL